MKFLATLLIFLSTLGALSVDISNSTIANGKTALFEFKKEKGVEYESLTFLKKKYKIYQHPLDSSKLYALLPVSYYAKVETKKVKVNYKKGSKRGSESLFVKIVWGDYKKEEIHVQKSKVNPTKNKHKKRIAKEYKEAMRVYGTSTPKSHIKTAFILPLESFITSDFGKARVYNGSLKGYHSGTDFRAKVGTPIIASNDGVVALVKKRFYSGGTVVIDHGQGIYTCYFHMSEFSVKVGQSVAKGDVLGLSGQSGRVTGPHLHFSVRVGGTQVDPLQFIKLMNDKLLLQNNTIKETK